MTNMERDLILRVVNDVDSVKPLAFHFHQYSQSRSMFLWLVTNNLTGQKFLDWLKHEHKNSPLLAGAFILSKVKKNMEVKPVIVGTDFF